MFGAGAAAATMDTDDGHYGTAPAPRGQGMTRSLPTMRQGTMSRRRNQHDDDDGLGPLPQEQQQPLQQHDESATHAQRIVKELYVRYKKQMQRWRDYRNLFFFLAFLALYLAVLYLQRQANTAYQVHATMNDVLVPSATTMSSTDDVYAWLKNLLQSVWVDPKCGDGVCESPFEFASYSRFGCRADCGKLQDVQNLTTVQTDIYWDFSHPVGSIPSSDLMQQASWNICPVETPFANGCYYDQDVSFDRLAFATSRVITDMPDGNWTLVMRRDIFMKTWGAVREYKKLVASSYYFRVYVAALSALAEQNTEMALLAQASAVGGLTLLQFVQRNLRNVSATNATDAAFQYQQLLNATCACGGVPVNGSTSVTWLQNGTLLQAFNNSVNGTTDWTTYQARVCTPEFGAGVTPRLFEYAPVFLAPNGSVVDAPVANGSTLNRVQAVANRTAFCARTLANLTAWQQLMTNATQQLLIDRRLGDGSTTGKIAARNSVYNALTNYILGSSPELFDPIVNLPQGALALGEMWNARVAVLQEQFVAGVFYATNPAPAAVNISRRVVYAPNVTLASMAERARARLNETRFQQVETLGIQVPADPSHPLLQYPASLRIADLLTVFHDAMGRPDANSTVCQSQGCTPVLLPDGRTTLHLPNATLPDADSPELNSTALFGAGAGLRTAYNLVEWQGNNTAYMSCDLPSRGREYVGQCAAMPVTCVANGNNDTVPYNCTDAATNATVPGTLASVTYRQTCEFNCDLQLDCNTLCDCSFTGGCNSTAVCVCKACTDLNKVASADSQFVDISNAATSAGRSTATLADVTGVTLTGRRQMLQASSGSSTLDAVLQRVSEVKTQQDALTAGMAGLQAQVNRANALAEARANDNRIIDLIQAGRQDIAAGQARVEAKLDVIIGKQNESLALANAATAALQAIQGLAAKQLAAQQALEKAVTSQLSAIKTATYSGVISLTQALALWKRARRERALTIKAAKLANVPCNSLPAQDNVFSLDNGNVVDNTTSRERNIGLTNRVLQGLLLHQYRTNETNCTDSKFNKIQQTCTGPITLKSYGVDPTFKLGTTLYNPDLDDVAGTQVLPFYNCSLLASPTYNVTSSLNVTTNPSPYCAELFNGQRLPYAFHHFPMEGKQAGFPVLLDINLDAEGAQTWETYLEEGLYLDQHTRALTVELMTYNAPLRIFGYFNIEFYFSDGGSIKVTNRLSTVRVELYNSYDDDVRFAFEVILSVWIYCMMLYTFYEILITQKKKGNMLRWFSSGWNWVELISNGLLTACMCIWWVFVTSYSEVYDVALRYDVYANLQPTANYLALNQQGQQLTNVVDDINQTRDLIDLLNWYFALNGINILLLIARVLRLMDFQPRLGVVTRSLWLAGPDLIHFAIVAGMVFIGYAMMAHLIFGNALEQFQTFGNSVNTCFEILLGNIDVNEDLRNLGGLQSVAGALFFWSYELLVFMVLLNFLLAIIVDAFSEVKEKTHETVGIHTELYQLMRDKWRSLMGTCSSNYISDAKLGALLKQWAGDDQPEEKPDQQADVQKLLTILNEDLDEEDLRNVLMECLKDAPQPAEGRDQQQADRKRTGLARCLPRRKRIQATPQEVSQAAKYIIDRFGVPVEAEEDDGLGAEDAEQQQQQLQQDDGSPAGDQQVASGPQALLVSQYPGVAAPSAGPQIDKERDQLASALARLAEVQRELADGQRNLMSGQRQLAEQQAKLVNLMHLDGGGGGGPGGSGAGGGGGQ